MQPKEPSGRSASISGPVAPDGRSQHKRPMEEEVWSHAGKASVSSDAEAVPEVISQRVLRRVLVFAGLPTVVGVMSLPLFYYLRVHHLPSFTSASRVILVPPTQHLSHLDSVQTIMHLLLKLTNNQWQQMLSQSAWHTWLGRR